MMLTGIDAVRKRPGMYIGSTQKEGVLLLIREVVEALSIEIDWKYISILKSNKRFTIRANQPLPFTLNYKICHPYRYYTDNQLKVPVVGFVGINALAKTARFRFKNRIVICQQGTEIENIEVEAIENFEIQFELDETVLQEVTVPMYILKQDLKRMIELFDYKNRTIELKDENNHFLLKYEGGLRYIFDQLSLRIHPRHEPIQFSFQYPKINLKANIIFAIVPQYMNLITIFDNDLLIHHHGTPVKGFFNGLTKVEALIGKKTEDFSFSFGDECDVRTGVAVIIQIFYDKIQYYGAWKGEIMNKELLEIFEEETFKALKNNPQFLEMF